MLSEKLQIYRDTYELCRQLYGNLKNIPRTDRYGLYGDALSMSMEALDNVYIANSDRLQRPAALTRYLQLTGGIRSRVRLLSEHGVITPKKSVNLMFLIDKMQKQATGWRNASQGQSCGGNTNAGESAPGKEQHGLSLSPESARGTGPAQDKQRL